MSEWKGRRVLILGMGASGRAAVRVLHGEGAVLTVADERKPNGTLLRELEEKGIPCLAPAEKDFVWEGDAAVISPGFSVHHPWIRQLQQKRVSLLSELELGWSRRGTARVLAVTGSNGKSTLVRLCALALRKAGFDAREAGNCGPPVCEVVADAPRDWLVLEVSSFQLETVDAFAPDVGIWLNLYPNHLDRHGTMEAYAAVKARMFARQNPAQAALFHESVEPWVLRFLADRPRHRVFFGIGLHCAYRFEEGRIYRNGREERLELRGTYFDNPILGPAVAAAVAAFEASSLPIEPLAEAIRSFQPLLHRMERVGEIGDVLFVNDSKATNLAALKAALRMMDRPIRLIAGGRLKETDLESAKELLQQKCRKVYVIGESALRLFSAWGGFVEVEICHELEKAVRRALDDSCAGEAILLSPAAASFDQYRNFEERGDHFRGLIAKLKHENHSLPREARKK